MAAPEESSPPMVAGSGRISVFLIYPPPPSRDTSEAFIKGVFRSGEPSGAFDGRLRRHEAQKSMGGAPLGAPPGLFPPSELRLRGFKVEFRHIWKNINAPKIPGQFESV